MKLTLTVGDAAQATGLSTQTIRRKVQDGELEATKVGRRVLVNYESLTRLVTRADEKNAEHASG